MKFFFFFFDKQGCPNLFEYLTIPSNVFGLPFHTYQVITMRNPIAVTPRCWQKFSNPGSREVLKTTKPTP